MTNSIKILRVLHEAQQPDPKFLVAFDTLDRAYPEVNMEYITLLGDFTPQLVEEISNKGNIKEFHVYQQYRVKIQLRG